MIELTVRALSCEQLPHLQDKKERGVQKFFLSFCTLFYTYCILDFILAAHVLDEVIEACGKRLTTLKLVNATRSPFEMLSIVGFVNLKVLMISPHNLGDDLVECMGKFTNSTL